MDTQRDNRSRSTEGMPREDTVRRWPSVSQGERPHRKPNLPGPGASTLKNRGKIGLRVKPTSLWSFVYVRPSTLKEPPEYFQISSGVCFCSEKGSV